VKDDDDKKDFEALVDGECEPYQDTGRGRRQSLLSLK
jgi:hypothetical protein